MSTTSWAKLRFFPSAEASDLARTLSDWRAEAPEAGVFAWLAGPDDTLLSPLQAAARAADVPLFGARFPLLLRSGAFVDSGVWLCRADTMPVTGMSAIDPAAPQLAADAIADAVERHLPPADDADAPSPTLWLVFDGAVGNIGRILDALYLRLGTAVRYAGVNAGLESFEPSPCLFDASRTLTGGVAWALLPEHDHTTLLHDYQASRGAHLATTATGNRVEAVDFRPAFDFYRERVHEVHGVDLDADNFYRHAASFPLAIQLANGQIVVRMPIALEPDGAIRCSADVPENALLVVAEVSAGGSRAFARRLVERLRAGRDDHPGLVFYCAGRRLRIGKAMDDDLHALRDALGHDLAGALSLGEIGSVEAGGYPMLHNGALVTLDWSAR